MSFGVVVYQDGPHHALKSLNSNVGVFLFGERYTHCSIVIFVKAVSNTLQSIVLANK